MRVSPTTIALLVPALLLTVAEPAAAAQYLDPGAGSVVVQVVIAGLVGAAAVLKFYWGKIGAFFGRGGRSDSSPREISAPPKP